MCTSPVMKDKTHNKKQHAQLKADFQFIVIFDMNQCKKSVKLKGAVFQCDNENDFFFSLYHDFRSIYH